MVLHSLRSNESIQSIMSVIARFMVRLHFTPDVCTVIALIMAGIGGIAFGVGNTLIGMLCVILNSFFDMIDGAIARLLKTARNAGDYLDHVLDRYADMFFIIGIFAWGTITWNSTIPAWAIGVFALTGVLMSSYLGTQAQAVGLKRDYGGLLGRADRLMLMIVCSFIEIMYPTPLTLGLPMLGWLLVIFGVLGHITAMQRFATGWYELTRKF